MEVISLISCDQYDFHCDFRQNICTTSSCIICLFVQSYSSVLYPNKHLGARHYLICFNLQSGFPSQMKKQPEQVAPTTCCTGPIHWQNYSTKQSEFLRHSLGYWKLLGSMEHLRAYSSFLKTIAFCLILNHHLLFRGFILLL